MLVVETMLRYKERMSQFLQSFDFEVQFLQLMYSVKE